MKKGALLFIVNDVGFFLSHRLQVAIAAKSVGFDVHLASAPSEYGPVIKSHGFEFHALPLSRSGTSIIKELNTLVSIVRLMHKIRPKLVHLVTIKPILYGGIAARITRVPAVVAAVSGLGTVFISRGFRAALLKIIVQFIYRLALSHKNIIVIFQNPDDKCKLLRIGAITESRCKLIKGSGVDLSIYRPSPEPDKPVLIVMVSRLLKDKGVLEFVEAANICSKKGVEAKFKLVGDLDRGNPASLTEEDLVRIKAEGVVELAGYSKNIANEYAASNIACLPSYREGLPKSLVEAAACGRTVITTDVPGCRDAIDVNRTGLLVPVKDAAALSDAITALVADDNRRLEMGRAGRIFAENEFSITKIVSEHMDVYKKLRGRG